MATSTVEDYVKEIYLLQQPLPREQRVALGRVAAAVGVVPGTATTMIKALADAGLVRYESRHGTRLTPAGEKLALHILRRHRLVELFLVRVLNFDWADVHEEAHRLEHALSDRVVERIDQFLGRPAYDPHGDPIPTAALKIERRALVPLPDAKAGVPMVVARILDQDSEFLNYATQRGLIPGAAVTVDRLDAIGGSLTLRVANHPPITLGLEAAQKVSVGSPS